MTDIIGEKNEKAIEEFERRKALFDAYVRTPEYEEKLHDRLSYHSAAQNDSKAKSLLMHLCKSPDDPAAGCNFFIQNFGYTFDPRPQATFSHIPFIPFEFQEDAVRWMIDLIDNGQDGLVEKSRDMGMSWILFIYVPLWYWLFRDGVNILLGSYKEALVDDRTMDSLFGKLDYAIQALPQWMLPNRFDINKHRTHMKLTNPVNGNVITGDTMNPNFGRGSRKTAILFDELGFWDHAKAAWESSGDSTACRIANSTPNGYNFFAMLRETEISRKTFHWKLHPLKDDQWYSFEKSRKTEEAVAQELDISYTKSLEGRVYPEWNEDNVTTGYYPYDPQRPLYVGWDFGLSDNTCIIWVQPDKDGWRIIDTYTKSGKLIEWFVPLVTGIIPDDLYAYSKKDLELIEEHKEWKKATHFGDPAGRFQNQVTNLTVLDVLRNNGIYVNFKDSWKTFPNRKTAAKLTIKDKIFLNDNSRTKYFSVCMMNAAYPKVKVNGIEVTRSEKPKHDSTSHYRSAFEYLAQGLQDLSERRSKPHDKFKPKTSTSSRRGRRRPTGY